MQSREFDNWNAARRDTVVMPRVRPVAGVSVAEHTGTLERAAFACVWNMAARRAQFSALLRRV